MLTRILAIGVLVMFASMAQAVPVLTTSGATGVEVLGKTYDVDFVDGSCVDLFNGCDDVSDFEFQTIVDATAASIALMSLIETTADPDINGNPSLMDGCSVFTLCFILTPFAVIPPQVGIYFVGNDSPGFTVPGTGTVPSDVSTVGELFVYARWMEVPAVPLPASAPLLMAGMAGFAALARRRKRKAG